MATCEGQVVGYVIFGFDVDVESLATCFDLGAVVDEAQHGADAHAHLEECVMNPVFAHRKKAVVLDAMRLFRKTLATYRSGAEPQGGEIPDVVACDFRLCAGRKPLEGLRDANFALFAFTNRIAAAPRVAVNARVVVVGATETALATVDRLASHPTAAFNNVALVAAGGGLVIQKNGGAGSAAYDAAGVAKLALGSAAGAQVVDAEMTGLDRANKAVLLSDGTELPYDVLALATGHRDQTRVAMDAADDVPIERLDDLVSNLTREEAAAIESVLVYGDTLEALGATRKLLSVGVRPEAVREIAPPSDGGALSLRRFAMEAALQTPGLGLGALEVPGKPPAVEGAALAGRRRATRACARTSRAKTKTKRKRTAATRRCSSSRRISSSRATSGTSTRWSSSRWTARGSSSTATSSSARTSPRTTRTCTPRASRRSFRGGWSGRRGGEGSRCATTTPRRWGSDSPTPSSRARRRNRARSRGPRTSTARSASRRFCRAERGSAARLRPRRTRRRRSNRRGEGERWRRAPKADSAASTSTARGSSPRSRTAATSA